MVATPLATLNPYLPIDIRKFYWVATIASIGAASAIGQVDIAVLLARADRALYRAKANGRNRVEFAWQQDGLPHGTELPANLPRTSRGLM